MPRQMVIPVPSLNHWNPPPPQKKRTIPVLERLSWVLGGSASLPLSSTLGPHAPDPIQPLAGAFWHLQVSIGLSQDCLLHAQCFLH